MEIQIISGFLGAGKTTFLNRYLPLLSGKTVVIENEFGDIGIDGSLIRTSQPVRELRTGCICCSLAGDFLTELRNIQQTYRPDLILMEPSGIGKLSEITSLCSKFGLQVTKRIVLVDVSEFLELQEDLGTFFLDQIAEAGLLLPSHLEDIPVHELSGIWELLRYHNRDAAIYTEDWRDLTDGLLLKLVSESPNYMVSVRSDIKEVPFLQRPGETFTSVSVSDLRPWGDLTLEWIVPEFRSNRYGNILRVKGYFPLEDGEQIYFDLTPSHSQCHRLESSDTSEACRAVVIGCQLNHSAIRQLLQAHRVAPVSIKYTQKGTSPTANSSPDRKLSPQ